MTVTDEQLCPMVRMMLGHVDLSSIAVNVSHAALQTHQPQQSAGAAENSTADASMTYVTDILRDNSSNEVDQVLEDVKFYLSGVVNPALCVFGIIGNIFNVIVLTRRRMQKTMDCSMERAAHLGLIALAVSDMLYCATRLPEAFVSTQQAVYHGRSVWMYVQIYGDSFQNIFMHTSTWLTVIMAAGRYAAICRPLQARYMVGINATIVAVVATVIFWVLMELPTFWSYSVRELVCEPGHDRYFLLDHGPFITNPHLFTSFTYLWAIIGYFIPVAILAYCNVHLIKALRESIRMRQLYRVHARSATYGSRITPTLVAIVCMFIALVSPSVILNFLFFAIKQDHVEHFTLITRIANVLQTMNFAFNFVLYCLVNVHFRETWKELMYCKACRPHYDRIQRATTSVHSNATKASFIAHSSFETVI